MTTTILTDEQITDIIEDIAWPNEEVMQFGGTVARSVEHYVLQSPEIRAMRQDAALGRIAMKFVDRAGDYCKEDPAERICDEFNKAISDAIDAIMEKQP